ncbi:MAG: hypothetical protein ACLTH3_09625 [Lachnospira sp.]
MYNHQDLRKDLIEKGHTFANNSDTEVLIHARCNNTAKRIALQVKRHVCLCNSEGQ